MKQPFDAIPGKSTLAASSSNEPLSLSTETIVNLISLGGTVSHGKDILWNQSQDATKAFDGSVYTSWCFRKSEDYPWIAWTFLNSRREVANMYDVSVPGDTSARNPKRWKVYGSNQGGSWVLLDERSNIMWSEQSQTRRFVMNNVVAYSAYKFEFIERCGDDPQMDMYHLSEWTILSRYAATPSPAPEPQSFIYDPFIFGDTTNYAIRESALTDMEVLRRYLVARDAYPTMALQNTRVLALSGMTLEGIELLKASLSRQTRSTNSIDLYLYSNHKLGHLVDASAAVSLISLAEFTHPSRIVFGEGTMKREGMAAVIQWMVNNRDKGYFKELKYFQISGHSTAAYNGTTEEGLSLQSRIVSNLHIMCTEMNSFPKLKTLNFNDNGYNEFNNGFDAALRDACDPETTGVTIRAYQVSVWYPPMCSAMNADNYAYYDRDDEKEMSQCRFTWNWEMSEE